MDVPPQLGAPRPDATRHVPDELLERVLAVVDTVSWRYALPFQVCRRWLDLRDRASATRVRVWTLNNTRICWSAERSGDNTSEAYVKRGFGFEVRGAPALGRISKLRFDGVGDNLTVSVYPNDNTSLRKHFLRVTEESWAEGEDPLFHRADLFTLDPDDATRFEAVESMRRHGRDYTTLPGYYYIRLKTTPKLLLKVHTFGEAGLLHIDHMTRARRHRTTESHGFCLYRAQSTSQSV